MEGQPKRGKGLREGFSTGSCAAAAAKAAALTLVAGSPVPEVEIGLPMGRRVTFKVERCELRNGSALCSVIKDAGDDPDCTHGAEICAEVRLRDEPGIEIDGGEGVARVTKPGLGIEIGRASITRVPLKMMRESVEEAAGDSNGRGAIVLVTVPRGEEMAKKTLNHRLGLIGGISILGTTGIVKPYSTAAYKVSITQGIDVALANGCEEIVITTGGNSEKFAQQIFPLPEEAFVQMGDWVGFTLKYASKKGLKKVGIVGMIGKLSKIADGQFHTHARRAAVNLNLLAAVARECGAPSDLVEKVQAANTARDAAEMVTAAGLPAFFDRICAIICENCQRHVEGALQMECVLTDHDGKVLGRAKGV
jgi:cobalt-precorrin-5B (C1)-methyltransferase